MEKLSLLLFRIFLFLLGIIIFFFSVKTYIDKEYRHTGEKIITTGKVVAISACAPVVSFTDKHNTSYKVEILGGECHSYGPEIGDNADVEYYSDSPQDARILRTYSDRAINNYGIYKYSSLFYSLFGIFFIFMALIPNKRKLKR